MKFEVVTVVKISVLVIWDFNAMWTCRKMITFWKNILPPSSGPVKSGQQ
jgi:hypothetical protein